MKLFNQKLTAIAVVTGLLFTSCKKDTPEGNVIDCNKENTKVRIYGANVINDYYSKTVVLDIIYTGSHKIKAVRWDYGNGETSLSEKAKTSHFYILPGVYKIKAKVTLGNGNEECMVGVERDMNVN